MKAIYALLCLLAVSASVSAEFSRIQTRQASEKIHVKSLQDENNLLYMVNNSIEVGPGFSNKLLEVDLKNKKYRVVTDKLKCLDDSVSGSAVCGDNFFTVVSDAPISCKFTRS